MSLAMTLLSLMSAWVAVALAMLWGVMRIARRRQDEASVRPKPVRCQRLVLAKPLRVAQSRRAAVAGH